MRHWKSRKWKVFRRLPEVDESVSGRPNIFWYYERHSLNWYRFYCKIKKLKFSIFFITSVDNRKWRSTRFYPQHLFNTQDLSSLKISSLYLSLFSRTFTDKISFKKTKNGHIYQPEVNFLTKVKNNQLHSLSHLPWKFQVNPFSHLWEIARTKNGEKNNKKKKQYNHYKVFRLKRKTLIRNSTITIRSSVWNGRP